MRYYKNIADDYIISIGTGAGGEEITESVYNELRGIIANRPTDAPEGYGYRLKTDLTWELYELPPMPPIEEDATEEDYQEALEALGVNL